MLPFLKDTIVALATPTGNAAIALLRVSGPQAVSVVEKYVQLSKKLSEAKVRYAHVGYFIDAGEPLDQVMVIVFKSPHSYTGEDVVEISCHGSAFVAHRLLEVLLRDARMAERGEFTLRAFLNGKMDLTQAEAVGDLVQSRSSITQKVALKQLQGSLFHRMELLLQTLTGYRMALELEIDFLEQDLPQIDLDHLSEQLMAIRVDLVALIATGKQGRIAREGLMVCLAGPPNVGKSSLFNSFLQTERAIVTPIPGTTRDYIEEEFSLDGYLIRLVDTAGLREATDTVERIGIDRSSDLIQEADVIISMVEPSQPKQIETWNNQDATVLQVMNKADLLAENEVHRFQEEGYILCSTTSEAGLMQLKQALTQQVSLPKETLDGGLLTNSRQIAAVQKAIVAIEKALLSLKNQLGLEFTAFDLREASNAIEEVIGKITTDELLNRIFDNFCIGK